MGTNVTDALIEQASTMIDNSEEVLGAGYFEVQEIGAAVAGGMIGGSIGDSLGGLGGSVGNAVGLVAGQKAYAESQGLTERVLVAVTAKSVLVLNGDTSDRLAHIGATFDRSTCDIVAKGFGPLLSLHLENPATGQKLKLNGSGLSKSDRSVESLLKK